MDQDRWEQRQQERAERHRERTERRRERWEQRHYSGSNTGGMIFALLIIAAGVMFLLRNLGIFYFESIWEFWPVILIAIGVSKLTSSSHPSSVIPGLILAGIGTVFLLQNLGYIYGDIWRYLWPGVLIAVGVMLLARHLDWGLPPPADASPGTGQGTPLPGSSGNWLHIETVFGGDRRRVTSQEFEGGKIATVFGGVEVDLRDAATTRREIVLNADAVFGGVELMVPETWNTEVRGTGVFGGYVDKTHPSHQPDPNAPRLIVKGGAVFGSVIVRN